MLEVKVVNLKRIKVETLVVPVCEDHEIHTDKTLKALISAAKAYTEFKGKKVMSSPYLNPLKPVSPGLSFSGWEKPKR